MILNSFAVFDGGLSILRLGVAVVIILLAIATLKCQGLSANQEREQFENRTYLLSLVAFLLLFLNLISWPLLYLVLQSYVPEWPGVMCVYGVTRIGTDSPGISRFLPCLLFILQILKPVMVFVGGCWFCLYWANRSTARSPLMGRMLIVLIGFGFLGVLDSFAEGAYLLIPKKDDMPEVGCCTGVGDGEERFLPVSYFGEEARPWLATAFYVLTSVMVIGLFGITQKRFAETMDLGLVKGGSTGLGLIFLGSILLIFVGAFFLVDVAAPVWLHLPHHHCPYDLIPRVPEAILGLGSYFVGTFSVGWALFSSIFAFCAETENALRDQIRRILTIGMFGYAGALAMVAMEFYLA